MKGFGMRYFWFFAALMLCVTVAASAGAVPLGPRSFDTVAHISADESRMSFSTAIATIEPRFGAPGYSWLRITFFSFRPNANDIAGIEKGDLKAMKARAIGLYAVVQLAVDKKFHLWQVDMSIPGHACTIASTRQELERFSSGYTFDGKTLKLKSKGTYTCDMSAIKVPNQKFGWEIDLTTSVFHSHS